MNRRLTLVSAAIVALSVVAPVAGAAPSSVASLIRKAIGIAERADRNANEALSRTKKPVGTENIRPRTIRADDIALGAIGAGELASDAVTAAAIADGAVGRVELAAGAVGSEQIADGTIHAADFAAGAINLLIGSNSVGSTELADNSVDSAAIINGSITDADVSETAAIADTKLATIATAGKVADTALSTSVSKLGSAIDTGELADGIEIATSGNIATTGELSIGTDSTPITRHISVSVTHVVTAPVPASACVNLTNPALTVTGAAPGDTVSVTPTAVDGGIETTNLSWMGYVSAADAVTIRACNPTLLSTIDLLDTQTWRIDVWKH
jgi:hypothetical protein